MEENEIIINLHMPKTGGSSFKSILEKVYGSGYLYLEGVNTVESLWNKIKYLDLASISCISGHFPFGIHTHFPDSINCKYITFLRDPIERLMSMWNFNMRTFTNVDSSYLMDTNNFMIWIQGNGRAFTDNGMVRVLSNMQEAFVDPIVTMVSNDDLEKAKENLSSFYFIGTTETFDLSLERLSKKLNWEKVPYQDKIYSYPDRLPKGNLPHYHLVELVAKQKFDILLWEYCRGRE